MSARASAREGTSARGPTHGRAGQDGAPADDGRAQQLCHGQLLDQVADQGLVERRRDVKDGREPACEEKAVRAAAASGSVKQRERSHDCTQGRTDCTAGRRDACRR